MEAEKYSLSFDSVPTPQAPKLNSLTQEEHNSLWSDHSSRFLYSEVPPLIRSGTSYASCYALMNFVQFITIIDLKPKTLIEGSK
jgi:hypothetical protein